jgi:hypothetical protein
MYIYDRKFSGAQFLLKHQSITSRPAQRNVYYPARGISGFEGRGGSSGSYVWEGLGQLSVIEPFADQAYGPQMIRSADRTKDLTDAIRDVKRTLSPTDQQRLEKVAFAIAKLGTGDNPVKYAGVKENDMLFSASLLKVTLLYASFELVSRVNKLAPSFPGGSPRDFLANVQKAFGPSIASAIPWIPNGEWRKVKFDAALTPTRGVSGIYTVKLSPVHRANLETIVANQLQDWAARACMRRLGYSYVNGALAAAGFLDLKTKKGIWYANDLGGGWPQFHVPVDTKGKSSVAMTALGLANLLTAMHRGTLIDQPSSQEMMRIMRKGGSWISQAANAGSLSFTSTGAKVGHHASRDAKVSSVKSEGVFLDHNGVPFVAVWQNYPDASPVVPSDVINVYRVIDEVVKKWP